MQLVLKTEYLCCYWPFYIFVVWIFNFENVHPVLRTLHSITVINGNIFRHLGINHDKPENKKHFDLRPKTVSYKRGPF